MKGEIYKIGDAVFHDTFGSGIVLDKIHNPKVVLVIKFDSLETCRNIVANFYGLRRNKK